MAKRYEIQNIGSEESPVLLVQPQREKAGGGFGPQFEVDGIAVGFVQENFGRFIAYRGDERLAPRPDVKAALADLNVGPGSLFFRSNIIYRIGDGEDEDEPVGRIRRRGIEWYAINDLTHQTFGGCASDADALNALLISICAEIQFAPSNRRPATGRRVAAL